MFSIENDRYFEGLLRSEDELTMIRELYARQNAGVKLMVEDHSARPEEISRLFFASDVDAIYMPDHILDERNRLVEIRYNRVTNR